LATALLVWFVVCPHLKKKIEREYTALETNLCYLFNHVKRVSKYLTLDESPCWLNSKMARIRPMVNCILVLLQ